jgi:hypothetical protein
MSKEAEYRAKGALALCVLVIAMGAGFVGGWPGVGAQVLVWAFFVGVSRLVS